MAFGRAAGTSGAAAHASASGTRHGPAVSVLQMNLCDSGFAGCFTGRAVEVAAAVIRDERPDVVTLNEVCRSDVSVLAKAMSARPGTFVASAFKAAGDRTTGRAYRCVNGQRYGIGLLALLPSAATLHQTYGGVYPSQDLADPEERVWLCVDVPARFLACTTHTASASAAVALVQCRFLLNSVLPTVRKQAADAPVIVGADLNLPANRVPGPQSCLPAGYQRVDDGLLQDVVVSPGVIVRSRTVIEMRGSTDHPGLLVQLAIS